MGKDVNSRSFHKELAIINENWRAVASALYEFQTTVKMWMRTTYSLTLFNIITTHGISFSPSSISVCLSVSLSLSLSLSVCVCPCVSLLLCMSDFLRLSLYACLSVCLFTSVSVRLHNLSIDLCLSNCVCLYVSLCLCIFSVWLSVSACLSLSLSVYFGLIPYMPLSACLYLYISMCLYVGRFLSRRFIVSCSQCFVCLYWESTVLIRFSQLAQNWPIISNALIAIGLGLISKCTRFDLY